MASMLERHPNLMLDITWRVLDDAYFSTPEGRAAYVPFLNAHSDRILPGTDFLASRDKDLDVYREELEVNSRILGHLDDEAFRNIALGESYFRLLGLDYEAPPVCSGTDRERSGVLRRTAGGESETQLLSGQWPIDPSNQGQLHARGSLRRDGRKALVPVLEPVN